jgi:hypothetical protein
MNADTKKHGDPAMNGGYERQDLGPAAIAYFLIALGVVTALISFALTGMYKYLDARERREQPPVSPLITKVPEDTRHVPPKYPQATFPTPQLEVDERTELNDIRLGEEQTLNSYGWIDQKAGTVRIPIERAMELTASRLQVRPQNAGGELSTNNPAAKKGKK